MARYAISKEGAEELKKLSINLMNESEQILDCSIELLRKIDGLKDDLGGLYEQIYDIAQDNSNGIKQYKTEIEYLSHKLTEKSEWIAGVCGIGVISLSSEESMNGRHIFTGVDFKTNSTATASLERNKEEIDAISQKKLINNIAVTELLSQSMASAFQRNYSRIQDSNIVRGRLLSEFEIELIQLKNILKNKKSGYAKLMSECAAALAFGRKGKYEDAKGQLNILKQDIALLESKMEMIKAKITELAEGFEANGRYSFVGCGDNSFSAIHGMLIHHQGKGHKDFKGTCGLCACSNAVTLLGDSCSELDVIKIAVPNKLCTYKQINSSMSIEEQTAWKNNNGGTSYTSRHKILELLGYNCTDCEQQSIRDIYDHVCKGEAAIINVNSDVLYKRKKKSIKYSVLAERTDHVVTVTGFECNKYGDPVGMWIHDTGIISDMGNAFYVGIIDYDIWKYTPGCVVQYISKK